MENDFHCSAGDSGDGGIYCHRRRNRAAPLELAAAAALRMATDYFLASAGNPGAVPRPLRRTGAARLPRLQFPPSHEGALRTHDPRGAGTIPGTDARTLGRRPIHRPEQSAMKLALPVAAPVAHPLFAQVPGYLKRGVEAVVRHLY